MAGSNSVQFITGTIAPTAVGSITINFGKSLSDFIVLVEMTDESLEAIETASPIEYKLIVAIGKKTFKTPQNYPVSDKAFYQRWKGGGTTLNTNTLGISNFSFGDDSFTMRAADISSNTPNALIVGYTYNYTVIPLA